jgi:hypothetical protein
LRQAGAALVPQHQQMLVAQPDVAAATGKARQVQRVVAGAAGEEDDRGPVDSSGSLDVEARVAELDGRQRRILGDGG